MTPSSVRRGLRGFRLDRHRVEEVGSVEGVAYVDDSKATNPHAAQASLLHVYMRDDAETKVSTGPQSNLAHSRAVILKMLNVSIEF